MKLIVSHNNTDFDGLASMLAASKLYSDAVMVFEGKPTRQVREFLALHKDALPISDIKTVDLAKVTTVVLVDTRSPSRVGSVAKLLGQKDIAIHIYDHHPATPEDLRGERELVEAVGAATTLLVELLQKHKIRPTPFEATVLALGIYEDTGNLLFESTTARDARALSFLLDNGANLKIVGQLMDRPLSREQKSLLNTLLTASRHHLIKGVRVLIASAAIDAFVAGLALLVHKISEIENLDVIFAVVQMDDRVHIVARGKGKHVALNEILREFGGAGHEKAASATIKNGNVEEIIQRILALLEEKVIPEITAREIMSMAVRSISPQTTMEEAWKTMLRYGYTGIPVVEDGKLCGVISQRDVDKALHHGLGHAKVTGYMSRQVKTITPDATLSQIEELMITYDIGRLPVVADNKLVGIISRSDVLRALHGQAIPVSQELLRQRSLAQGQEILRLFEDLPLEIRDLFKLVQVLAEEHGYQVFVVGGFVRDLLLGIPNLDIDFVVEGDGLGFAALLSEALEAKAQFHPQFGTANLLTKQGLNLDVVTARIEYYDYPASLPVVESSSLRQDLYRRDFTINAMAIDLRPEGFGNLKDYYGGYRDLQQGEIRILHNLSFVDDPKRILRALRFEQRLRFRIEAQTLQMLKLAIKDRLLDQLSRDRLKDELILILQEQQAEDVLQRIRDLGAWDQVFPGLPCGPLFKGLGEVRAACDFLRELGLWDQRNPWRVNLLLLFSDVSPATAEDVLRELNFERRLIELVRVFITKKCVLKGFSSTEGELSKSAIHRVLNKSPKEILAALLTDQKLSSYIRDYLTAWARARVLVNGKDLKALGIPPGPLYGKLLAALWDARLEGKVKDREEELCFVKSLLEEEANV